MCFLYGLRKTSRSTGRQSKRQPQCASTVLVMEVGLQVGTWQDKHDSQLFRAFVFDNAVHARPAAGPEVPVPLACAVDLLFFLR
jgi:hypothetical protein